MEKVNTADSDFEAFCEKNDVGGMLKVLLHDTFVEHGSAYKDLYNSFDGNSPQGSHEQDFENFIATFANKNLEFDPDHEVMKKYKEIYKLLRSHSRKDRSGD